MVKVGIISDIHLGEFRNLSLPHSDFGTTRQKEILDAVEKAHEIFVSEGVDLVLDGGDIIDSKNSIVLSTLWALLRTIRSLAPLVSVTSNHGAAGTNRRFHIAKIMEFEENFWCAGTSPQVFGDLAVWGIDHRPDSEIEKFYEDAKKIAFARKRFDTKFNFLLIHQGIKEASHRYAPFQLEKNLSAKKLKKAFPWMDLIIAGHFHEPEYVIPGVLIPGAVCRHDFRDANSEERGCWIWDSQTKNPVFYPIESPRFIKSDFRSLKRTKRGINVNGNPVKDTDYLRVFVTDRAQIEKLRNSGLCDKYRIDFSLNRGKESDTAKLRDSTMTFDVDDFALLKAYIDHRCPENLDKNKLLKYGKKIIDAGRAR